MEYVWKPLPRAALEWMCFLSFHLGRGTLPLPAHCSYLEAFEGMFVTDELNMFLLVFREPQGIIACCNPVPPLVRQQINEMHLLIQQAREMPLLKVRSFPAKSRPVLSTCEHLTPWLLVVSFVRDLVFILRNPKEIIGVRKSSVCVIFMIVKN